MWLVLLIAACEPEPPPDWLIEDTGFRGAVTVEEVSADCDAGDVRVRTRLRGWGRDAVADVWDGQGGYARITEGFQTTGFRRDRTCDVLEARTGDTGTAHGEPPLAPCTSETIGGYTVLVQVESEKGCAGAVAWGAEKAAAADGTIEPPAAEPPESDCGPAEVTEGVAYVEECADG